ncbi:MAG: Mrp/NBP35 family ATP-binding protein [Oscillospiraceae bacterium]|nr:Mrp/NBP35 family ATP-binding protein [Oscillospiraceae bacterium]
MSHDHNHDHGSHGCSSCSGCGSHGHEAKTTLPPHPLSKITTVIGITGGKGGTGKSLVTSILAAELAKAGQRVAIFDADIFSPTIPEMFELPQGVTKGEEGLYPALTERGIKVMSIGPLLEDSTDAITLHSAIMGQILQRLWSNVIWDEIDCLLIDLPPGTTDVSVTAFESLPLDGVLIVSTPQAVVNQAVARTVRLALENQVPILGLIENFSGLFSGDAAEQLAARFDIPLMDRLAFDPVLADAADEGKLEALGSSYLPKAVALIEGLQ